MRNSDEIAHFPLKQITLPARNARTHSREQLAFLRNSVRRFGVIAPLIIDENKTIVAGEARYLIAEELGFDEIPALQIFHLTGPEKRALALSDNKISEGSGWNSQILREELIFIAEAEINIDIGDIGFIDAEVDILFFGESDPDDEPVETLPTPQISPVTREGDVWLLGGHRLLCGNALEAKSYDRLLSDNQVDVIVSDPPYNVPINGFVGGKGKHKHREFAEASGEMSREAFKQWIEKAFQVSAKQLKDSGIYYAFIDWRGIGLFDAAGREEIGEVLNIAAWVKPNGGMGSFYRSRHELCIIFRKGDGPHQNNVELGRHGRNRTNVWEYPGLSSFGKDRDATLALHPTVKPTAMIADILQDCTGRGHTVLDPFAGSGTVFVAAEKTGRIAFGIELDPVYCDVAIERWQNLTGHKAILAAGGETFAEIKSMRAAPEGSGEETSAPIINPLIAEATAASEEL